MSSAPGLLRLSQPSTFLLLDEALVTDEVEQTVQLAFPHRTPGSSSSPLPSLYNMVSLRNSLLALACAVAVSADYYINPDSVPLSTRRMCGQRRVGRVADPLTTGRTMVYKRAGLVPSHLPTGPARDYPG